MAAEESYPADLKYHREHDWARIEGDTATLGITWYAQDALGEIVHFEPPGEGDSVARDESYGEVESVKAVSDLISPLSGEVVEVNARRGRGAREGQRGPVRRGLAREDHASPSRQRSTTSSTWRPTSSSSRISELPLADRRRPGGDARGDRGRLGRGALRGHSARPFASGASSTSSPRSPRRSSSPTWRSSRRETPTPAASSRSSAPGSTTTTSLRSWTRSSRAASSSPPTRPTSPR